ncbi:MAG: hypothetical protein LBS21_13875 [Clostridiales bacterium]|jgi:hypothetical protein|nr:hypothetical protein [Clostridiales bacterium]
MSASDIVCTEAYPSMSFAGGKDARGIFTLPKLPAHYSAGLYLSKLKLENRMIE